MPFVSPTFQEVGEIEIFENLMAIIHRDQKKVLDYHNLDSPTYLTRYGEVNQVGLSGEDLPDWAIMTDGAVSEFTYPLLSLAVEGMISEETKSGNWLQQDLRIGASFTVSDTTLKAVRKKARQYARALRVTIRAAGKELLPDAEDYLDYTVDTVHRYLEHKTNGTTFIQPVEMEIKIKFGEV